MATGGGFSTRQLYSDTDEVLFDAQCPIMLNGIDQFVTRDDFRDRSLVLVLPRMPDEKRRDGATCLVLPNSVSSFHNAKPHI